MKAFFKGLGIAITAIVLTTFTIDAVDNIDSMSQSVLGSVYSSIVGEGKACPEGMVEIVTTGSSFCIDVYESSVGEDCPYNNPTNQDETRQNLNIKDCSPVSLEGEIPWRNISQTQASLACVKAGKRLPTNSEWYLATMGTPDKTRNWTGDDCNVAQNWKESSPGKTGTAVDCVSAYGVYDLVGNVWEWMGETVNNGVYNGLRLPETGYISAVDENGTPLQTGKEPDLNYFEDKLWVDSTNVTGIFRGGFWGSETDGGPYSMHTQVAPSFVGGAVGFRCVTSVDK